MIYDAVPKEKTLKTQESFAVLLYLILRRTHAEQYYIAKSLFQVQDKLQIASIGRCQTVFENIDDEYPQGYFYEYHKCSTAVTETRAHMMNIFDEVRPNY